MTVAIEEQRSTSQWLQATVQPRVVIGELVASLVLVASYSLISQSRTFAVFVAVQYRASLYPLKR